MFRFNPSVDVYDWPRFGEVQICASLNFLTRLPRVFIDVTELERTNPFIFTMYHFFYCPIDC